MSAVSSTTKRYVVIPAYRPDTRLWTLATEVLDLGCALVVVDDGTLPISGTPREVFSQGDRLEELGLGLPAVTRIFHRLKQMGADVDPSVFTAEQARDAILAKLERRGV